MRARRAALALVVVLFGGLSGALWDRCSPRAAQAQSTASLSERQVIALERIASEMARIRRECR